MSTYPTPPHGWTCFHCGEHFEPTHAGMKEASRHFSKVPTLPPECLDAANPMRKLARRARVAEATIAEIARQRDAAEDSSYAQWIENRRIRHKLDCGRDRDPLDQIETLQGRVIAAEAVVAYIEKRFPGIVARARQEV